MKLGEKEIEAIKKERNLRVIFCLPGDNFTSKFLQSWTDLISACSRNSIEFALSNAVSPNVYFVRSMCLGGNVKRGPNQKPWDGGVEYDYIMWIDSDQVFTGKEFLNLLKRAETDKLDILSGVYMMKDGIHFATVKDWDTEYFEKNGNFQFIQPKDIEQKTKPFEVAYTGFGWLLVRKGVFESLEYPWFSPVPQKIGELVDFASEDASWCQKIREKGYKIYIDPQIRVGHEKRMVL